MEPLAPDWRTLGVAPSPATGSASSTHAPAARNIPLSARTIAWIGSVLVATAVAGAVIALAMVPTGGGVTINGDVSALPVDAVTAPQTDAASDLIASPAAVLVVDVEGAVAHPGLVHVPAGGRVGDALARAGGFAPDADLSRTAAELNLAQLATDGLKVVVPVLGDVSVGADTVATHEDGSGQAHAAGTGATDGLVDLNHATEAELDALPGVGPATIAKIIAARQVSPFRDPQDLRTRGVIGDAVFTKLASLVTVGR